MDQSTSEAAPQWSPDHHWWWDGSQWIAAADAPSEANGLQTALAAEAGSPTTADSAARHVEVRGKVRLTSLTSAAKLLSGPSGWKEGSVVLPVMEGRKLKLRAGFKSAEYSLASATASLLGPREFRLTGLTDAGDRDEFVFSCSDSSGVVAECERHGVLIAEDSLPTGRTVAAPPVDIKQRYVPLTIIGIELVGGSPDFKSGAKVRLSLSQDYLELNSMMKAVQYDLRYVSAMAQTQNEIERRVTATRLLAAGVFAFAWKKGAAHHHQYLNVEYDDGSRSQVIVFETDKAAGLAQKIQDATRSSKQRRGIADQSRPEPTNAPAVPEDIPAKLKQLAELRDAGVLTDQEFAAKKADLLARM